MTITKADKHQAHMPRVIHYRGQMIYLRIAPADLPNATWTKRDGHDVKISANSRTYVPEIWTLKMG